jgi:hypothetical protein
MQNTKRRALTAMAAAIMRAAWVKALRGAGGDGVFNITVFSR